MTDYAKRLEEIRARCEAATPGPWIIHVGFDRFSTNPGCYGAYLEFGDYNVLASAMSDETKQFIAHSRSDIPWLLNLIQSLEEELERGRTNEGV